MSSAYYSDLIAKCDSIINQIGQLYGDINRINETVEACKKYLEGNTMNGIAMGDIELDNVSSTLTSVVSALATISAACLIKRGVFVEKYGEALNEELKHKTV